MGWDGAAVVIHESLKIVSGSALQIELNVRYSTLVEVGTIGSGFATALRAAQHNSYLSCWILLLAI